MNDKTASVPDQARVVPVDYGSLTPYVAVHSSGFFRVKSDWGSTP